MAEKSVGQQPNFQDNLYASEFNGVNGITFDGNGKPYVWEKEGRVLTKDNTGTWITLLDISEEVNPVGDHGLKGFALHPDFLMNGFIYLLYDVDRYHLMNYGTANYDSTISENYNASIGRITRYTALSSTGFNSVNLGSRLILLGRGATDGFPMIHETHSVGSLLFGTDGTLLASCGESSTFNGNDVGSAPDTYFVQALTDGILKKDDLSTPDINEDENVGSWRAQMKNCLAGKIIRIDPTTGEGLASNPFFDSVYPNAAQSKVWAMGLRNPFRMCIKPNTGEHLPSEGNPGTIYVGDVGSIYREEINVVTTGGQNFGWPTFEGVVEQENPVIINYPYDREAEFSIPFVHTRPAVDYRGTTAKAYVNGQIRNIGTTDSTAIPGIELIGNASIGGIFYQGDNFPSAYKGQYFHGDFGNNWIHNFSMNSQNELTQVQSFLPSALGVTCIAENPVNGYLYYVYYVGSIREVKYSLDNQPPKAVLLQNKIYGGSPLNVQFDGSQSYDPEHGTLTYLWNFGDGTTPETGVSPNHTFPTQAGIPTKYTVTLTVSDSIGNTHAVTALVSVDNTPPVINNTSIDGINYFPNTTQTSLNLTANITDAESADSTLTYKWEVILHHDNHEHPEPISYSKNSRATLSMLPCDGHVYFYRIKFTITDPQGLSTVKSQDIYPVCGTTDIEAPTIPTNLQASQITTTSIYLSWDISTDNYGVSGYQVFKNDILLTEIQANGLLIDNLESGTTYRFNVRAKDASNNISNVSTSVSPKTLANHVGGNLVNLLIYGDALSADWNNLSTITSLNISNNIAPTLGTHSIKITTPKVSEAIILENPTTISTIDYPEGISFWVFGEGNNYVSIKVKIYSTSTGGESTSVPVVIDPNHWTPVLVNWSSLGSPEQVQRIVIEMNQNQAESIYIDEIKLQACSNYETVKSGNWDDTTIWSCGNVPTALDSAVIHQNHTVTVLNGVSATLRLLQLLGSLKLEQGGIFHLNVF